MGQPWYEREIEELEKENAELTSNLKEHKRLHKVLAQILDHDAENPSLCDLVSIVREDIKERDELRAQLARCVDVLTTTEQYMTEIGVSHEYPVMINLRKLLASLPKTASLDAEILRCADEQEAASPPAGQYMSMSYNVMCSITDDAVRARNEVK
jgi:hypothetical protein